MKTALVLKKKSKDKVDELIAKEEEIQQLQLQLAVRVDNNYYYSSCVLFAWLVNCEDYGDIGGIFFNVTDFFC